MPGAFYDFLAAFALWASARSGANDKSVSSPSRRWGSCNAVHPSGHVGLIGESGFRGDPAQAVGSSRNTEPRRTRPQFCTDNRWCSSVRSQESPGYSFTRESICFRP
jgi:hypothetical protein